LNAVDFSSSEAGGSSSSLLPDGLTAAGAAAAAGQEGAGSQQQQHQQPHPELVCCVLALAARQLQRWSVKLRQLLDPSMQQRLVAGDRCEPGSATYKYSAALAGYFAAHMGRSSTAAVAGAAAAVPAADGAAAGPAEDGAAAAAASQGAVSAADDPAFAEYLSVLIPMLTDAMDFFQAAADGNMPVQQQQQQQQQQQVVWQNVASLLGGGMLDVTSQLVSAWDLAAAYMHCLLQ
jgi:hypothetical protein